MVLLVVGVRTRPRPDLHGAGLPVLLALLGLAVGGVLTVLRLGQRRYPASLPLRATAFVVMVISSATLVWTSPDGPGFVGGFLAAADAASWRPRRLRVAVTAATLVVLAVAGIAGAHRSATSVAVTELGAVAFYRVGYYARRLRERTEQAERLMVELDRGRAAELRATALAERQWLAREMHDVLAHSLSGLLLHLEAARLLTTRDGTDPRLADAVTRARHLAEAGLGEARRAIGALRDEELPGPELLPALTADFQRDTGVECALTVCGDPLSLGFQARLTLYRVAQEALTNIRRHARDPYRVAVRVRHDPDGIRLTVQDFAAGPADGMRNDHGYGISGMRERAALLGGTLSAAPTGTGFRVALWVPG